MNGTNAKVKQDRREKTLKILKMIAIGALIIGIGGAPSPRAVNKLLRALILGDTRENRRYAKRKIRQLQGSSYLEKRGVRYAVSDKGQRLLSRAEISKLCIPTPKWSGKWFFIAFDIPQSESYARKELNRILLGMGLAQYQQSVLIFPHPLKETLLPICKFLNVTRYVSFIIAERIDGEEQLKKHFSL